MKKWFSDNYQLICTIIGFLLFWLLGNPIVYTVVIILIGLIIYGKAKDKIELYNFDILLSIMFLALFFISLAYKQNESIQILVIVLGITYICSFFRNKRFK